jgi:hypothetical protein
MVESAWECVCGNVAYDSIEPEECLKCGEIDSFTQLPEELISEREKDLEAEDEMPAPKLSKPSKAKPKLKKPGRKK